MSFVALNGATVLWMRQTQPLRGRWTAEIEADSVDDITGAVKLTDSDRDDGITYHGTVEAGGVLSQSWRGMVVGGAGGLGKTLTAKSYRGIEARSVISDLLSEVGETLDPLSTGSLLAVILPFWTRTAERASVALGAICDAIGATWRVVPSGSVWVGAETWLETPGRFQLDRDFANGTIDLAPDTISLTPGVTMDGVRVGRVEHCIDDSLRTTIWPA